MIVSCLLLHYTLDMGPNHLHQRRSLSRHKLRLSINGCQMEIDDDLNDDQKKALQK